MANDVSPTTTWKLPVGSCSHHEGHYWIRRYDWLHVCQNCHAEISLAHDRADETWVITIIGKREPVTYAY